MSDMRKSAIGLLEKLPEEQLIYVVQILQGLNGLYPQEEPNEKKQAFTRLMQMRKKAPDFDPDAELEEYRREKYDNAGIG